MTSPLDPHPLCEAADLAIEEEAHNASPTLLETIIAHRADHLVGCTFVEARLGHV